ncbi:hypothetical protein C0J08_14875 [Marinomonas sp. CT5]|uniref:KilA-N domain-containing protein n=1 Tax=Marinomonas sp. CT5 TaxID=2066133 RepID=UPI001BAF4CBF|nr:KilA-N domain-containing protein [Marinomonas sp. CT5]QUX96602.1 hypothetical protein C0J08_14875 [Marinomonas sp. CT5]
MGIIATKAHKLHILSEEIRILDGLYSLNDLHKVSGAKNNHRPSLFVRTDQTKELIEEVTQSTDMCLAIKTRKGGGSPGTWVCKELVYAYAMWISPKFHLHVIRAFDQLVTQPRLSDTTERKALNICVRSLANARSHAGEPADYASVWKMVNGYLGVAHIEEATVDQVERGVEFVQRAIEGEYIGRLDAPIANPNAELESRVAALEATTTSLEKELIFIHSHAEKLTQDFNGTIYPALKGLNPKFFAGVRERMFCIYSHSSKRSVDGWKQQSLLSSQQTH